jgi:hypothetical protein
MEGKTTHQSSVAQTAGAVENPFVDPTYLASLLLGAISGLTPSQVSVALKDPRNYSNLSAYQMGQVLKADHVFPKITPDQMRAALQAAGYSQADIESAMSQLFPVTHQYRQLGPVGAPATAFDDTKAAKDLNQPITKISVRYGNIIDSIQAFYGSNQAPLPQHGGNRGTGKDVIFASGDVLVEVSGYYGLWFGRTYILQLTFKTRNGRPYGPFGDMQFATTRNPFKFTANSNEQIIAFLGSIAQGLEADHTMTNYLTSIGVTLQS